MARIHVALTPTYLEITRVSVNVRRRICALRRRSVKEIRYGGINMRRCL